MLVDLSRPEFLRAANAQHNASHFQNNVMQTVALMTKIISSEQSFGTGIFLLKI